MPQVVLVEVVWVLGSVYGVKPSGIIAALEMVLEHRSLVLLDPEVVAAALETYRAHPTLEFSDGLVLETARKAGHLPLGTFDRRLGALNGTVRVVR